MLHTVQTTCASAVEPSGMPLLTILLAILFSVYIGLDGLLAAGVIVRKARDAEMTTARALGMDVSGDGSGSIPLMNLKPL